MRNDSLTGLERPNLPELRMYSSSFYVAGVAEALQAPQGQGVAS